MRRIDQFPAMGEWLRKVLRVFKHELERDPAAILD